MYSTAAQQAAASVVPPSTRRPEISRRDMQEMADVSV